MMRRAALAILAGLAMTAAAVAEPRYTVLDFDALDGWADDDHAAALAVFRETCRDIPDPDWRVLCRIAAEEVGARSFFELFFRPVLIEDGVPALFTGYFEPELRGAREPDDVYHVPIYGVPPELRGAKPFHSRAEIETGGVLDDKGLELAWVDDPVDAFFLQIQGSGRIRFADGSVLRVGYGDNNGHEYRSVGLEMVRRGLFEAHQVSAQRIRQWVRENPEEGRELLHHNPSFVFFRKVQKVPPERGPLGAMNRSVTAHRSVAVDPAYVTLGSPVWVEKDGRRPIRRLMVAQDTGSAIKGAQRADIFFGTGDEAGREAGRVRDPGRMLVLMPIQRAYATADFDGGG